MKNLTINTNPVVKVDRKGNHFTVQDGIMYQIVFCIGGEVLTSAWFFDNIA